MDIVGIFVVLFIFFTYLLPAIAIIVTGIKETYYDIKSKDELTVGDLLFTFFMNALGLLVSLIPVVNWMLAGDMKAFDSSGINRLSNSILDIRIWKKRKRKSQINEN